MTVSFLELMIALEKVGVSRTPHSFSHVSVFTKDRTTYERCHFVCSEWPD